MKCQEVIVLSFKSYLLRPFDYSHERRFFRIFSSMLKSVFQQSDDDYVLIGNIVCNGHQMDALLCAHDKIIVIDFKDYGGDLVFSENNPWQIRKNGNLLFVSGGSIIRNPYQQVNAYRHSLIQQIGANEKIILKNSRDVADWGHISSMVVFQQPVTFDEMKIPAKIKRYFSIADVNSFVDKISDQTSVKIKLSHDSIENLLTFFNVQEDNIFDSSFDYEEITGQDVGEKIGKNIALIDRLIKKENPQSDIEKMMVYYRTIIDIERHKDPSMEAASHYYIDWNTIEDTLIIDLQKNTSFNAAFNKNMAAQFPKGLYVGINVTLGETKIPILHVLIPNKDMADFRNIEIPIGEFMFYPNRLEEMYYPESVIDEISQAITDKTTINEKLAVMRNYIDEDLQLAKTITIALSDASPFTSQLSSELKAMSGKNGASFPDFLRRYILKLEIDNNIPGISEDKLIQVTNMNVSQKKAVYQAFNQKLTVVTGPPGTGKTQVVLNILANAAIHGKSVLVTSKNNQAVDNVKDRFADVIKEGDYLLRFGSKNDVREITIPAIESYVRRMSSAIIEDSFFELKETENKIREIYLARGKLEKKIQHRKDISSKINLLNLEISNYRLHYIEWFEGIDAHRKEAIEANAYQKAEVNLLNAAKNLKAYQKKYSGFMGFYNRLVNFKSDISDIKKIVSSFDSIISKEPSFERILAIEDGKQLPELCMSVSTTCSQLIQLDHKNTKLLDLIREQEIQLQSLISEEQKLKESETETIDTINSFNYQLVEMGKKMLNLSIQNVLNNGDFSSVHAYSEYLPDRIPWKKDAIPQFINCAKEFLKVFKLNTITTLSVKNAFPLVPEIFDLVVIDEASQCDLISAIPLIHRGKQIVIIGDPMQLRHITKIQNFEDKYLQQKLKINENMRINYVDQSLYDYCYGLSIQSKLRSVFLDEHYRCHPSIIDYSNKVFYGPKMGQELRIMTTDEQYMVEPKGVQWVSTKGIHEKDRNINHKEIKTALDIVVDLATTYPDVSIGITTPFSDQAKRLRDAIPVSLRKRVKADTIHSFQGAEKDIMVLSLVIGQNTSPRKIEWINKKVPYLLNVAVTRARNTIYIIGDYDYCGKLEPNSPLCQLTKFAAKYS